MTLRRQLGLLLIVFGVVLVIISVIGSIAYVRLDRANGDLTRDLFDAQSATRDFFEAAIDEETSVRGYQLDNDPEFLVPYQNGSERVRSSQASLRLALRGRPQLTPQVDAVIDAENRWNVQFARPVIQLREAGAVVSDVQTAEGKALFDTFRGKYSELYDAISAERLVAIAHQQDALEQLGLTLVAAALVVLILGMLAWQILNRRIVNAVNQLLRDVQRVTSGDIEHAVAGSGPADVKALAAGVDAMRTRIVRDLRDVEVARIELARSNADLEQFAYVASHDLQEPLRKVASFCQLLEQRYRDQLDDRGMQYIDFAVDGAKRMQRLISDLLSFSRVGRNTASFEVVDLNNAAASAVSNLSETVEEAKAVIDLAPMPSVNGEPALLLALFQNLIGNAIKFHREGIPPHVRVAVSDLGASWQFDLSDNGIGIEPTYAERIFVIFQRLHGRDEYGGTGIGLAMCKKIIEFHGGKIWLDTDYETGTMFHFTLPKMRG